MNKEKIKAVIRDTNEYLVRYIIIDSESGEILDDAQGYGYKTKRNAYAAYSWKTRSDKEKQIEKDMIIFFKNNIELYKSLEDCAFYAIKDNSKITEKDIIDIFNEYNKSFTDLSFTSKDVLKKWYKLKF